MPIFDHYDVEYNLTGHNMHVSLLFLQVQYDFTTHVSPLDYFHLYSPITHCSLYPDMCDNFVILTNIYPTGFWLQSGTRWCGLMIRG